MGIDGGWSGFEATTHSPLRVGPWVGGLGPIDGLSRGLGQRFDTIVDGHVAKSRSTTPFFSYLCCMSPGLETSRGL